MRVGCRVVLQEALMKTMLLDCVAPLTVVYRSVTTRTSKYIEGGHTALHYVASKGWVEVAEIMLSKGAKVNSKDKEITETGGKTVWGEPSAIGTALEGLTFDVFLDNNGKDFDTVKFWPVVDWAKSSGAGPFLFISSVVIYKQTEDPPHVEGDTVKADAGHVAVRIIFLRFSETGQTFAHNT